MQKHGFTLIEIIIAVTILSFIMVSVFGIYSNIIALNKRLAVSRSLQENARNITEIIAKDIRENGIAFSCYNHTAASSNDCP
ncbi:MAG: PulJ/GspJ family protein [Patescibacteria group bacterium]